ncbi:MAG: LysR family transcriptional regulator [Ilumatobacteraceae bacterium]
MDYIIRNRDRLLSERPLVLGDPAQLDLPLGMEVRHLAALEAIARTRSFSQAAALLGYAQSAISQQMATLERVVGHKLIERPGGPRPVSLTPAGEVLLRHAAHITARLGAAKADLDALAAGDAGSLRVGTFQSASTRLLPPTLNGFREHWSRITVALSNQSSGTILEEMIRAGQLDLAFSDAGPQTAPLDAVPLIADPYVAMLPTSHPLAAADSVRLADLDGIHFISGSADNSCESRVLRALEQAGARPETVFRSDDNLTTQRLVAAGLGVAIVPLLAVELAVHDAAVAVLPIADEGLGARTISLVWHHDRYRSRASEAFVETSIAVASLINLPVVPLITSDPCHALI